jgi:hypothetical protein
MAGIPLPNGSQLAIATGFEAAKVISDIANGATSIAAATANGYQNGDIILLSAPGWVRADNQVHRAMVGTDANHFVMPYLRSTDLTRFPVGGGAGSAREISAWTQITKIPTFEKSGGDAKSTTTSYIDYDEDVELITGRNPSRLTLTTSYQPDSPGHAALIAASDSGENQVLRLVLKGGDTLYYTGQMLYDPDPTTTKDQEMVNTLVMTKVAFTRIPKYVP